MEQETLVRLYSKLLSQLRAEESDGLKHQVNNKLSSYELRILLSLLENTTTSRDTPLLESLTMASMKCRCCGRVY